jgi:GNAT superfamily N-acetyltransferase
MKWELYNLMLYKDWCYAAAPHHPVSTTVIHEARRGKMKYEERNVSLEEYQWLRKSVGWWHTDPASTKEGLENSLYSVTVVANGKVIAIGRVIGDKGLYFYIQDLIVHPDFQSKGIGRKIMGMLKLYIDKNAKPGAFIALMAAKGLEAYYKEFGFQPRPIEGPGMFYIKY